MSWRTASPVIWLRDTGRILGFNRWVASFRQGSEYESNYEGILSEFLREGDVVWDVGANVGYYTQRFASKVGESGVVIAFEPSSINFPRLLAHCANLTQVRLVQAGLGDVAGYVGFVQGADDLGATSRVSVDAVDDCRVEIRVGDDEIANGMPPPNVLKIDVEGFEGEVLAGLKQCLTVRSLRAVGVEVHFELLAKRGLSWVPREIEHSFRASGFKVQWADSSHLIATREL
jgi:FkbM family methyltransferase